MPFIKSSKLRKLTPSLAAFFTISLFLKSCIQPFSPPEVNSDQNYLVVDGFLNVSGKDTSRIELRRTQNINQTAQPDVETGASISVEEEAGEVYTFSETGSGLYVLPPESYDVAGKYRLRIATQNGQEYLSEYVTVSLTPPIDSITYKVDAFQNAMVFHVNTHDAVNRTQFYRWKFDETWQYEMTYYSALELVNNEIAIRKDNINRCWGNKKSGSIQLGSTVRLSDDIIKDQPINTVPISTNRLFIKYSILVKQYGLSKDAFEYWTTLSKTTQTTGSLFDPLPSLVTGNIRNTSDPDNLAFGYFSASTEETKRLTITPNLGTFPRCTEPDTIPLRCAGPEVECPQNTTKLLLTYWGKRLDSVLVATPDCTDCRTKGGTTVRPSFW